MTGEIDQRRLLAEIEAEARDRRASGALPPDFEALLDSAFARLAPPGAAGDDFDDLLERAEQLAFVNAAAPVTSALPLVTHAKRAVRKAIAWEVRHVARQVSAFASTVTEAVGLLGRRVGALEQRQPALDGPLADAVLAARAPLDVAGWAGTVVPALRGVPGRVLHAESGDGALLARLVEDGVDAYGVDPVRGEAAAADVHVEDPLAHLAALPDGSLGGLVLSGCVDRLPLGALVRLPAVAAAKVTPGGSVVLLGTDPRTWLRHRSPVEADLSPGRPLHHATWTTLLSAAGLDPVSVVEGPREEALAATPEVPAPVAAALARLADAVLPPSGYAVVARRRGGPPPA